MEAPEKMDASARSNADLAESYSDSTNGEEKVVTNDLAAAVHDKPLAARELLVQQLVQIL